MRSGGTLREVPRDRRRIRRKSRILRLWVAIVAAAVAGCTFGVVLTAVARGGQSDRLSRQSQQRERADGGGTRMHLRAGELDGKGGVSQPHAEKVIIRNPFTSNETSNKMTSYEPEKKANCSVAQELWEEVRILCWIMTQPKNHATKAMAVKETWGRRCNSLIFVSTREDASLPTVPIPVTEGRYNLWGKTRAAFTYLHKKGYLNDQVDWVLKADDDTFVVMENLRYLLTHYDPEKTVYLGLHFKARLKMGFMSGGTGYVLSRIAAKRFVTEGLPGNKTCRNYRQQFEDVEMGRCMAALGARFVDARESNGTHRFFPYQPERHLNENTDKKLKWLKVYLSSPISKGKDCCSRLAISFHYISPSRMREMYYLIYHLTPYGIRDVDDAEDQVMHDTNTTDDTIDVDAC